MGIPPFSLQSISSPCNRGLNTTDLARVSEALPNDSVQVASGVQFFRKKVSNWNLECTGAALLIQNESKFLIKVLVIDSKKTVFNIDIPSNFHIQGNGSFQTFDGNGETIGLSFTSEEEAKRFSKKVSECLSSSSQPPPLPTTPVPNVPIAKSAVIPSNIKPTKPSFAPPAPPALSAGINNGGNSKPSQIGSVSQPDLRKMLKTSQENQSNSLQNSTNSLNTSSGNLNSNSNTANKDEDRKLGGKVGKKPSFFKGLFSGSKQDQTDFLPISDPKNFTHPSTIGWNANRGTFEIKNIPKEWKKLFEAAGISNTELQRRGTSKIVMNCIMENTATPPPPPPNPPATPAAPPTFAYRDEEETDEWEPNEELVSKLSEAMNSARPFVNEGEEEDWSDNED
eukprot:TRINITY_DN2577_c0_g3_i1.p1 TRINITY_DN2577_c0_g3~~TRINITY_DN2577_c0_g3_i1.p1  ORF type:complete len:421 (-),score=169.96 TRINITY_DN2577_c0_g3_i1:47-1234(-)